MHVKFVKNLCFYLNTLCYDEAVQLMGQRASTSPYIIFDYQ